MNALKNYVIARMLWDPTLNPDELIDGFLRGYYRSAAPHIRQYMQVMHQAVQVRKAESDHPLTEPASLCTKFDNVAESGRPISQDTGFYMNEGIPSNAPIYTPANLLAIADAMASAVIKAQSEPRRIQKRVDAAKLSVYYIVLVHWQNVTAFAATRGKNWPLENTREAAWEEFTRVWNETGVTVGSEFHCDLSCVHNQLFTGSVV